MFQFVGYNFFQDGDALNSAPSSVDSITTTQLENAIFDHFNVTRNTSTPFTTKTPLWDYDTILDCDFNENINAGNVNILLEQITSIKIKRRVKGSTFDWLTLKTIYPKGYPLEKTFTIEDLNFVFNDLLNQNSVEYEYALVPVLNDVEGNYLINSIFSQFNGVFLGDAETIYKFIYDVNYGTNARNQRVGTFETLGSKYPIIVSNGLLSYDSGSVSATILNDGYEETRKIDPIAIVEKKEILKDYLTNHKAKILKDWCGNIWLCMVVDSPSVTYKTNSGMRIPNIVFNWTEIGKADNQQDLYDNGVLDEVN